MPISPSSGNDFLPRNAVRCCKAEVDGGDGGDDSIPTSCTYTYKLSTEDGETIAQNKALDIPRTPGARTKGGPYAIIAQKKDGTLLLLTAFEERCPVWGEVTYYDGAGQFLQRKIDCDGNVTDEIIVTLESCPATAPLPGIDLSDYNAL